MRDKDARDSYVEVEVDLPNGKQITGRSIPFRTGLKIKALLYKFSETMAEPDLKTLLDTFETATGVTEKRLMEACPSITILELTDLISRFIYLLRPVPTAAQVRNGTPDVIEATPAPAAAAPMAASPANVPASPIPAS